MSVRIGYKASAEQFGPRELLEFSLAAEASGLEDIAVSDHFQPWRHHGGHAPAAMPWLAALGQASERARIGTSVLTPTLRYHPSMVAQSFATLASLSPGRVFLGVGSGEAMNETPATGVEFPGRKERRLRLAEAIRLIKLLWSQERVDFDGDYYRVSRATIYDRPEQPVPVYVAASGPLAAKLAGRVGEGFICTSGKDPELYTGLLGEVEAGARSVHRDPSAISRMIEIKVSYDRDAPRAYDACRWWAALALTPEQKEGIEDALEMERAADANADRAHTRFIVSDDPDDVVERIATYLDLGFDELVLHGPGGDQRRFLEQFSEDVMPALRERAELTRLRAIDDALGWISNERAGDDLTETRSVDLAAGERAGLIERTDGGLRVTARGDRVAADFSAALASGSDDVQGERLSALAGDVDPALAAEDALAFRHLAELLVWLGDGGSTVGDAPAARARLVRDFDVAVAAGVLSREDDGGVRLTRSGRELIASGR